MRGGGPCLGDRSSPHRPGVARRNTDKQARLLQNGARAFGLQRRHMEASRSFRRIQQPCIQGRVPHLEIGKTALSVVGWAARQGVFIHAGCGQRDADALNADTFHRVPAAPASDHHPQVPFPPADGDHRPQRATHLCRAEEGLFRESRLESFGHWLSASATPSATMSRYTEQVPASKKILWLDLFFVMLKLYMRILLSRQDSFSPKGVVNIDFPGGADDVCMAASHN